MTVAHIMIAAMSLFWSSQKQELEADPGHWAMFAFPRAELELTVRVPSQYVATELRGNPLAPLALDASVNLFDLQYDYGRREAGDVSQFTLGASLVRLSNRPANGLTDGLGLLNAITSTLKLPRFEPDKISTELVRVRGRTWLHTAGDSRTGGKYDSFATLIGEDEVLFVSATYGRKVVRDKKWLASRRALVREVLEHAILVEKK